MNEEEAEMSDSPMKREREGNGDRACWIELQHVSYTYPDGTKALDDLSLTLRQGETYVLHGPNGCGKSTLFRILTGLAFPTSGTCRVMGEVLDRRRMNDPKRAREFYRQIGFLFQNSETQLFCKTVEEEVAFGLLQLGLADGEVREKTEYYLTQTGMWDKRARAPFHLSGGEKKRVALAAVLAMEPPVLILDEPAAGLDEDGEAWMTGFLRSMNAPNRLILIAAHDRDLTEKIQGTALYMDKNHRMAEG